MSTFCRDQALYTRKYGVIPLFEGERAMAGRQLDAVMEHIRHLADGDRASPLTDQQLLERFVSRKDEPAFAALVRRHGPMILGLCRRVLHHVQDAEDVFQASFLVLARKANAIRKQESIAS